MIFFNVSWFIVWPESYFNQGTMYQGIKFVVFTFWTCCSSVYFVGMVYCLRLHSTSRQTFLTNLNKTDGALCKVI